MSVETPMSDPETAAPWPTTEAEAEPFRGRDLIPTATGDSYSVGYIAGWQAAWTLAWLAFKYGKSE